MQEHKKIEIEWDQSLELGIGWIDQQHKRLLERLQILLNAIADDRGSAEVMHTLHFLTDYVESHFDAEENLMSKYRFPHMKAHHNQHQQFMQHHTSFDEEFDKDGSSPELAMKIGRYLWQWFQKHISKEDRAFASFLRDARPV